MRAVTPTAIGLVTTFGVGVAYLLLLVQRVDLPPFVGFMPWGGALIGSVLTGYLARWRILVQLVLLAMGVALWFGLLNLAHEAFVGRVDLPGLSGATLVIGMAFPVVLIICFIGGALGAAFRKAAGA